MNLELVRILLAVGGLAAASYFDLFNNKNVPVILTYALIVLGFLLNLASFDFDLIVYSSGVALAILLLGYLIYKAGQIGGADILLFAGIALLLPEFPAPLVPVLSNASSGVFVAYPPVVSVFLVSGILSICSLSAYYVPVILKRAWKKKKLPLTHEDTLSAVMLAGAYLIVFYLMSPIYVFRPIQAAVVFTVLFLATLLLLFKTHISSLMVKRVKVKEIDEEDVLAIERISPRIVKKYKLERLLTPKEIKKLSKVKELKTFPVLKGMPPFVPYMLFALLLLVLLGDPVLLMLS